MSFKSERHLFEAIEQCRLRKLIHYIDLGRNIHVLNELGQNFLVFLVQQQQQEENPLMMKKRFRIFQYLIRQYNLDVHRFDCFEKNLFNWTTHLNCTDEALYLLRTFPGDLDILRRDRSGSCSLHYAVEHGNEILVREIGNYLLRYRLRFDIRDAYQNTPEDLAKKLGYEELNRFLAETSRATIFMSREFPIFPLPRPVKQKRRSSPLSSSSSFELPQYLNFIETQIDKAKSLEDWKSVAKLRAIKKQPANKRYSKPGGPLPIIHPKRSIFPSSEEFPSSSFASSSATQSEFFLHLSESQLSSSYRPSFNLNYHRIIHHPVPCSSSIISQRKMSQASSPRRTSAVSNHRKRDSEASQISVSNVQDRFVTPNIQKQHRQSTVVAH